MVFGCHFILRTLAPTSPTQSSVCLSVCAYLSAIWAQKAMKAFATTTTDHINTYTSPILSAVYRCRNRITNFLFRFSLFWFPSHFHPNHILHASPLCVCVCVCTVYTIRCVIITIISHRCLTVPLNILDTLCESVMRARTALCIHMYDEDDTRRHAAIYSICDG